MVIFILEPYFNDSHKYWAEGFKSNSNLKIKIVHLPAKHWKWRMHASAITLAKMIEKEPEPDHIIVSDMCDVSVLKSNLPKEWVNHSISLYFHENQINFPWNNSDQDVSKNRNNHYGFINYTSALASDVVFFNSTFHRNSFISALPNFLNQFPDFKNLESIDQITTKSHVSSIGISKPIINNDQKWNDDVPTILWNHRWEYDKNPESFFNTIFTLFHEGLDFKLIICGNHGKDYPSIFDEAKELLGTRITHFGYAKSYDDYVELVSSAHIAPVTSIQDFFGISALQSISHEVYPILPNRLAFPDHINSPECFYSNDHELHTILRDFLINWTDRKSSLRIAAKGFSHEVVSKYNWKTICNDMEDIIRSL